MDHLEGVDSALVPTDRHAPAVVLDRDHAVGSDLDRDLGGKAGHRLVDRVVDDLPDEVMQAAGVGRADVHARALAHGLQALEDLDALGVVVAAAGGLARSSRAWASLPTGQARRRRTRPSVRRSACGWLRRSRGSSGQAVVQPPEVLIVVVLDHDSATFPAAGDGDLGSQRVAQVFLDPLEVGVACAAFGDRPGSWLAQAPGELLGLAHRQAVLDDRRDQVQLLDGRQADEGPGVAFAEAAIGDRRLDAALEVEQAERVGDRGPGAADLAGNVVLGQAELLGKLAEGVGLLDRVEVFALDILDEGQLELLTVRQLAHDGRDRSSPARRAAWTRRSPATTR